MKFHFLFLSLLLFLISCRPSGTLDSSLQASDELKQFETELTEATKWVLANNDKYTATIQGSDLKYSAPEFKAFFDRVQLMDYPSDDYEEVQKSIHRVAKQFSPEDRRKLVIMKMSAQTETEIKPAAMLYYLESIHLFDATELKKVLETYQVDSSKAEYQGVDGTHKYLDQNLAETIDYITASFTFLNDDNLAVFRGLSKERKEYWTKNSNDLGAESRSEPSDLLIVRLKGYLLNESVYFKDQYDVNPIVLGHVAEASLQKAFDIPLSSNAIPFTFFRNKNPLAMKLVSACYWKNMQITDLKGEISVWSSDQVVLLDIDELEKDSIVQATEKINKILCGDFEYKLSMEKVGKGPAIAKPKLQTPKKFGAVASVALTREMNSGALYGALVYLLTWGYTVDSVANIDKLKEKYLEAAAKADILIPVSHVLSIDQFDLGREKGIRILAHKKFPNIGGEEKTLTLTVFLPPINQGVEEPQHASLDLDEVSAMLCERQCTRENSLLILNTSCNSERNLDLWMSAWQKAKSKDAQTAKMNPPIAIGSKSGFSTSNTFEILSHLEYPLLTLEALGEGKGADDIMSILENPPNASLPRRILDLLKYVAVRDQDGFKKDFDPVCNLEYDYYFDGTGRLQFTLTDLKNPKNKTIF